MPTWIYHITSISNLSTLLQCGKLRSKNQLQNSNISYASIAYEHIQERRSTIAVPCGQSGTLHDYVPFYFAARSPMLYAIHKGQVNGYQAQQSDILHLVTTAEAIADASLGFVFSDGHAVMRYTSFYDNLTALQATIDWDIMKAKYWHDTDEDGDRKRRRQAEFLVYESVPWSLIRGIGVINQAIADEVTRTLYQFGQTTPVKVRRNYYY
jgi:hypothetical protein